MTKVNFDNMLTNLYERAQEYESSLDSLQSEASNSSDTISISSATKQSSEVQVKQAIMEMTTGIIKNAADHTKGLGRKISG